MGGSGPPVLFVHGFPLSSHQWRNLLPVVARSRRVLALDLPGFGDSDKPRDARFDYAYFRRLIDAFLDHEGVEPRLGLVVHDLGGPIGLNWGAHNRTRIERLALFNTVVYPELSLFVRLFTWLARTPFLRGTLAHPWALNQAMWIGTKDRKRVPADALPGVIQPFRASTDREALFCGAAQLGPEVLEPVAEWIRDISVPVHVFQGTHDWFLPGFDQTLDRLRKDIPNLQVTRFENTGHFFFEERPEEVAEALAQFFEGGSGPRQG
jgi:haloalkane dehalogenase